MKRLLGASLILLCLILSHATWKQADASESGWLNSSNIAIALQKEFTNIAERPSATYGGNTDCSKRVVISRPEKSIGGAAFQNPITQEDCMNDALYGEVGGSWLVRSGTGVAGPLHFGNPKQFIIGGPNVSTGIIGDATAPVGVYVDFAINLDSQLKTTVLGDGSVRHAIKDPAEIRQLMNARGERLILYLDTLAFTANGDYAVFDSPGYGLVRLDTRTGALLSFGQPTGYNNGFNPGYQFAISADGRYVVQSGSNLFRVYDLQVCDGRSAQFSYLSNCPSRSLEEKRLTEARYGRWPAYIRFINPRVMRYYVAETQGPRLVYRQYQVSLDGAKASSFDYLALGDSFASGEGALNYKAGTDQDLNRCHTSLHSYGMLLGARLNFENYNTVACSGARSYDVYMKFPANYPGQYEDEEKQKDRNLDELFTSFTPGKITQHTFVEHYNPEAVTISIGGNDLAFADKLKHCIIGVVPSMTCFDTEDERRGIAKELYNLVPDLIATYQVLRAQDRRVYVLGYPKIIAPNGNCAVNVRLNAEEVVLADRLTTLLNDAIEFAAGQAGVQYVDVENLLDGRRLCEVPSDQTLVHGLSQFVTDGTMGFFGVAQESFHPKADAHKLYRDTLLAQTNNLTKQMPVPKTPAPFPRLLNADEFFIGGQIKLGVSDYTPKYENLVRIRVPKGSNWPLELDQRSSGLAELSTVRVELHSEPVLLGEFTTDHRGDLNTEIIIPPTTEPGFHSIHVYGTTVAGEKIDFYDYVLVGENSADLDGNGVLDKFEGCIFDEPSGVDTDQDFTDDACDVGPSWTSESEATEQEENPYIADESTGDQGDQSSQAGTDEDSGDDTQNQSEQPNTDESGQAESSGPVSAENDSSAAEGIINTVSVETMLPPIIIPDQSFLRQPIIAVVRSVAMTSAEPAVPAVSTSSDTAPSEDSSQTQMLQEAEKALSTTPASTNEDTSSQNQAVNNSKVYIYYLVGGVLSFVLLVGGILYLRRQ